MAEGLDFGHDLDAQSARMGDHGAHLVLGIEAAARFRRVAQLGQHAGAVIAARGANRGQFGIGKDLGPPAFVIGQVPMKNVHLVPGEDVDDPQHCSCVQKWREQSR